MDSPVSHKASSRITVATDSPTGRKASTLGFRDPGLDTVYDGAHQMSSTAQRFGTASGPWASGQKYSSGFTSGTARPWARKPSTTDRMNMLRGPGLYSPDKRQHLLAWRDLPRKQARRQECH